MRTTVWGLALWLAGPGNLPLWHRVLSLGDSLAHRVELMVSLGVLITGVIAALLSLLSWPRVLRPVATALVLAAVFNSYFMWQYGVVIDATMLTNVVNTNAREVGELLSWSLLFTLLLLGGPVLWWLWHRPLAIRGWVPQTGRNALGLALALGLVMSSAFIGYQGLASLMRNNKDLRYMVNPLNSVYAAGRLATREATAMGRVLQPVGADARLGASYTAQARPPLLVLVVGETARAKNWGLNGYARPTTPALARWQAQGDLVNYSDVSPCGTSTEVSLPCMFSPLTRKEGGDAPATQESLLDVLQRAGLAVLWLDNQSGCKGVCDRVPHAPANDPPEPNLCEAGECFDEVMLWRLDQRIAALDPQRRARGVVLVMHQIGSHGPTYHKRAPAQHKPFMPECVSKTLAACPPDQLVNAYDNTIAYTDHFLGQTLDWLQHQAEQGRHDTGLVYLSDHGESLGENGLYLHGMPYAMAPREQTQVPMILWVPAGSDLDRSLKPGCLASLRDRPASHDNLFHTVMGWVGARADVYLAEQDLLAACR